LRALILAFQLAADFSQRGAAHRVGGAGEEGLDLRVIKLGAVFGEPAAGLVVEVLQVIGRVAVRATRHLRAHFGAVPRQAAAVHFIGVALESLRGFQGLRQGGDIQVVRRGIEAGFDIGAVLHEEAQVGLAQFGQVRAAAAGLEFGLAGAVKPAGAAARGLHLRGIPGRTQALPGGMAGAAGSAGGAVHQSHEGNM
jgi:hypothetical protein